MVVSTIGIQLIWTARLLDSHDSKCGQTIRMTAACKLFPHILASARTQRQCVR
ncbi:hypothetical protein T12_369 [Trichinella patagoniensis]|uniref:Uncharacterized protein n=1 Tax=Trichinella patagoniensis TaxID=990121 RepID=A0A0V0YTR1_9BILA|nr:hypothetical protein T12_369 [Trichinella patagoniensis]